MTKPSHLLVVALAERFRKEAGRDISRNRAALVRLLEAVDQAVVALQDADSTEVVVTHITADSSGPVHLRLPLTREEAVRLAEVRTVDQLTD